MPDAPKYRCLSEEFRACVERELIPGHDDVFDIWPVLNSETEEIVTSQEYQNLARVIEDAVQEFQERGAEHWDQWRDHRAWDVYHRINNFIESQKGTPPDWDAQKKQMAGAKRMSIALTRAIERFAATQGQKEKEQRAPATIAYKP